MGFTLDDVAEAVEGNNQNVGAGYIERNGQQFLVRVPGQVSGVEEIGNIVLARREGVPIHVHDVAEVAEGQRGDALRAELLTPELAAARRLVASRAAVLPSTDPLEGEPVDLTRPELAAGDLAALASVEARLGSVVQGRLSRLLTVQAP